MRRIFGAHHLRRQTALCYRNPGYLQPGLHSLRRLLSHDSSPPRTPDFAFLFDIDGVLLRGSKTLPNVSETLSTLQDSKIPFLLLTNGGGIHEDNRAKHLSDELGLLIDTSLILQSHTPFQDLRGLKEKTVLVVGGEHDNCRQIARQYGFKHVVTPSDIFYAYPDVWPFSKTLRFYHEGSNPQPLPKPINPSDSENSLKIDAIFVYNDPRDWGLDCCLILDCLLSRQGILGTVSSMNGRTDLPNRGYQQDGQPVLFFSNPDLWFAAEFVLPRLGQGGFRAALEGLWSTCTGEAALEKTILGKPSQETYEFAERRLLTLSQPLQQLKRFYMIGDNPASDIKGANNYVSPFGSSWHSVLVRTGVYSGGDSGSPSAIVDDVQEAVQWALRHSGWAK